MAPDDLKVTRAKACRGRRGLLGYQVPDADLIEKVDAARLLPHCPQFPGELGNLALKVSDALFGDGHQIPASSSASAPGRCR